jgi:hypothetical protein
MGCVKDGSGVVGACLFVSAWCRYRLFTCPIRWLLLGVFKDRDWRVCCVTHTRKRDTRIYRYRYI